MRAKIAKTILDNNGKEYANGDCIRFYLMTGRNVSECFGTIIDIEKDLFKIVNVQVDKINISGILTVLYSQVKDGIFIGADNSYYYNSYY